MAAPNPWRGETGHPEALGSRERKRRSTHARLFAAALAEFERVGFEAARIEHICARAAVTRPTFYAHFQSKEGVLEELQRHLFSSMLEALEGRLAATASLEDLMDVLVDGVFDAAARSRERLRREVSAYACRHQSQPEWGDHALFQVVERRFDAARRSGEIQCASPAELSHWVMVTLNGFYASYASDLDHGRRGAATLLRAFVRGLRARSARS